MKQLLLIAAVFMYFINPGLAQLPSGSPAPTFTVTDLDGQVHDLYSYLNDGISVVIDVSATWCGPCWSYHNSGTLENLYNSYGPSGTGELMVIFMEGDASTSLECLYGPAGCVGGTQGNWVAGTPYPIVHTEGPSVRQSYQVNAYPTIFMISAANKKSYTTGGGGPSTQVLESYVLESFRMKANTSVTDATCGGDGAIELNVDYGYGNLRYAWSNGATTKNLTNLDPGVYSCTITDAHNHDIETEPIYIGGTIYPLLAVEVSSVDPTCFNGDNGSVLFVATGGNPDYTYQWDDGQTGPEKFNCSAGEHHLTVTDAEGCIFENFAILVDPEAIESSVSAPSIPCDETTGTVTISATGGTTPYTFDIGEGAQSSGEFTDLSPGLYTYTILDNNDCALTASLTLEAIDGPLATAAALDSLSCLKTEVEVTGLGSSSEDDISYSWKTIDGTIVDGQDSIVAIVSAGGNYILEVIDNVKGCVSTDTVFVKQSIETPQASIEVPGEITCLVSEVELSGEVNGEVEDYTILWSTTNGNIVSGGNTLNPVINEAGIYVMKVTSSLNGCDTEIDITVQANINTPSGEFEYTFEEGSFVGDPQTNSTNNIYLWKVDGEVASSEESPTIELGEGIFEMCLTVSNECGESTKCHTLSNVSILAIATNSTNITCNGQNNGTAEVVILSGVQPFNYNWSGPNGFTSTDAVLTGLAPGVYNVTVTDSNDSEVEESVEVVQPEAIAATSINIINDVDDNGSGSIVATVKGGTGTLTYLWSNGETTSTITGLKAGSYSLTVTDGNDCEKVFGPFEVANTTSIDETLYMTKLNIFPNPASNTININADFIKNERVILEINNNLGQSFILNSYNGDIKDAIDISNIPAGVYNITLTGNEFIITRRIAVTK